MSVKGIIGLLVCIILLFMIAPCLAVENFAVKLVEHVDGYGRFIEKTGPYGRGDMLRVYAQAEDVNHYRAYAVDFVFVIYDPEDYPVAGTVIRKEGTDWTDRVYAVFEMKIPDSWKTGKYRVEVYVFDVLNSTATKEEYDSYLDRLISGGSAAVSVHTLPRDEVDYEKEEVSFQLVDVSLSPVYIFDSGLKATVLPEGMNNTMQVSMLNAGDKKATFYAKLLIDGEVSSKQKVELEPYESKRVEFSIPQLKVGDHRLEVVVDWGNKRELKTLPIFVKPYLFSKPVMVGSVGNGLLVLSLNNYVLGSGGVTGMDENPPKFSTSKDYVMNRENSAKMLTNILAYVWKYGKHGSSLKVGLYYKSDERAEQVLPELLDYVVKKSKAPVEYVGTLEDYELGKADLLFYVTGSPDIGQLSEYIESGGSVIVDVTDFYFTGSDVIKKYGLKESEELLSTFYDLRSINKTVSIKLKTELKLPPELVYSNFSVSDFIVDVGKPVTISFDVRNVGGAGTERVFVTVNGEVVFNETVNFYPNEVRHFSFDYTPEVEGSYKVVLDNSPLSKVFFAKNETKPQVTLTKTPEAEKKGRGNAALITGLAGVLALLIIARLYLRQ